MSSNKHMDVSFTSDSDDDDDKKTSPSSSDAEQTRPSAVQSVSLIVPPQPPAIEDDDDDAETVTFTLTLPSVTNNTVATPPVIDSTSNIADENVSKTSKSLSKKSSKTADVTNGGSSETVSNGEKTMEADAAVSSTKKSTKSKKSSKVVDAVMDDKTTASKSTDENEKSAVTEGGEQTVTTIKKKKVKTANSSTENGDETVTKTKKKSKPITDVEPSVENTAVENMEPVAVKKSKSPEKLTNDAEQKSDETSEGKEEKPKKKKVSSRKTAAESVSPEDAANDAAPEIGEKVVIKKKKVKKVSATPSTETSDAPLIVTTSNAEISQPATSKGEEAVEIPAKKFTEVTEERLASVEKVEAVVAVQEVEPETTSHENKVTIAEIISDEKPNIVVETEQAKPSEVAKETPIALDISVGNDVTAISAATPLVDVHQVAVEESLQMAEGQSTTPQETVQITPTAKLDDVVTAADSTPILNGPSKLDEKESLSVNESATESTRENEESDFTYRRKSMDDFIKRILAEAREEQQKRMLVLSNDNSAASSDVQKSMEPTSSFTDKDQSMLDRRLASTERKVLNGDQPLSSKVAEKDLDEDLAEIGRYFTKRNQVNKYDVDLDSNDELLGRRLTRLGNDDDILRKIDGDSYAGLTKQQSSSHSEDSFIPRRREETADVVRSSIRPVRAVIEQQTDVIQQFKITSRGMDELEAEIRNLRETFLDRQARIETMRSAIEAENRLYEAEQNAANDRINQQKVPGGRFVREDFMASVGVSSRGLFQSALDDSYRRRSGSVSGRSTPSRVLPRDNTVSASWRNVDDDASSTTSSYTRSRRGGSVARERTYTFDDLLGDSSRSTTPRLYSTFETPSTTTTYTSSTVNTDDLLSGRGFTTLSSLNAATSSYLSPDTRTSYSTDYRPSSSYLSPGTGAGSSSYSSYSSGLSSTDPSRFRRAQSVSDVSYDRYSGGDGGSSSGYGSSSGGEFQSRFLSKVRSKKSGEDSGDRQFKSRFLRNTYNNDVRRYMSGSRGGQD